MEDEFLKARWVAALRSGHYEQGREALRTGDRYCCLGVLCDVSGMGEWSDRNRLDDRRYVTAGGEEYGVLPRSLRDAAGLEASRVFALISMNDNEGLSFPEIADWIEVNL